MIKLSNRRYERLQFILEVRRNVKNDIFKRLFCVYLHYTKGFGSFKVLQLLSAATDPVQYMYTTYTVYVR